MLGVGSPDAMSPILHHRPTYGTSAVLNFFFNRVTRCGPRLLLYLALMLALSFAITKVVPTGISDSIATTSAHLWELRPSLGSFGGSSGSSSSFSSSSSTMGLPPGTNNEHDALVGGGLRIVVFGENDIATSMAPTDAAAASGTAWTRELCAELGCTTYLSYVPAVQQLPRRSLTSNSLYGAATSDMVHEAKGATPANDFTYIKDTYPITWDAADLNNQVSRFLQQPAPRRAPKETVYVFSFGMWDVWSLAAFPYSRAESIISILVSDIFTNIETLYGAAHNASSIAFSKYTLSPLDDEAALNATTLAGTDPIDMQSRAVRAGQSDLIWDEADAEPFRAVVPLLFDPSLVPGWHMSRPDAPALHTKPEQLRNAVQLTKRWNEFVLNEMDNWAEKGVSFVHPADRQRLQAEAEAEAKKAAEEQEKAAAATATTEPPNISGRDEEPTESEQTTTTSSGQQQQQQPALKRDGIVFRLSDYVMDAIIDGQMKKRGLSDSKSFGKLSDIDSYMEVDKPCLMPATSRVSKVVSKITVEMHGAVNAEEEAKSAKRASSGAQEECERPDRHLFYTPFSLGQRAIEEVGRMSAAVVRANRSTRMEWEQTSRGSPDTEREPGSWKMYYMSS